MLTSLALSRARFGKETKMQILVSKSVAYARFACASAAVYSQFI